MKNDTTLLETADFAQGLQAEKPSSRWRNLYFWDGPASERGIIFTSYGVHWRHAERGEREGVLIWPSKDMAETAAAGLIARHPNKHIEFLGAHPVEGDA